MVALQHECLHPTTNKPYVKSGIGGIDNSIEGLQVWSNLDTYGNESIQSIDIVL